MKSFALSLLLAFTTLLNVSAQTVRLPYSEGYLPARDSVRLFYRLLGRGPDTVVVVPGGTGFGSSYLLPDLTPLAAHHVLLFYDEAGTGFSTVVHDTARVSIQRHVEDLETLRKHFHLARMTLLGHSTGGWLCGFYAAKYPKRVKALILENPLPARAAWMAQYDTERKYDSLSLALLHRNQNRYLATPQDSVKACWDYYALWARGHFATPAQARRAWGDICNCRQNNLLNPLRYYLFQSAGNWNLTTALAQVKAPALVIGGTRDEIPNASFEEWKNSLPDATLLFIPEAGHLPHVDHPVVFFTAVERFLNRQPVDNSVLLAQGAGVVLPRDAVGSAYLRARSAVVGLENNLVRLVNKAAWDSVALLYAPNASIYPPGAPPVTGRQGIASFWHTVAIRGLQTLDLQLIDLEYSGDLLTAHGKYTMSNAPQGLIDAGKFWAIYRRTKRGWQLQTDVFNSSLETRSPIEVPDYLAPGER